MKSRHPLVLAIGFVAFAMNPAFACSSADDGFEYGEAEMADALRGTWHLTFAGPEGPATVDFTLEQGPNPGLPGGSTIVPACGSRRFIRSAAACITSSEMTLIARVTQSSAGIDVDGGDGKGWFRIYGAKWSGGLLELMFTGSLRLNAEINADHTVRSSRADWSGAEVASTLEHAFTP
ncbi:MAG: hypothetical protein ABW133_11630 [Polyangiaceae bacterium]